MRGDLADRPLVTGVAVEVGAVARGRALVGEGVDLVHVDQAGQAARDEAGLHALGRQRQVRGRDETAEGLAHRRPLGVAAQLAAQRLGVEDDLVLAEQLEPVRPLAVRGQLRQGLGVQARGLPRAALVEQHDPVVLEQARDPAAVEAPETGGRVSGAPLQEHRARQVLAALAHDLAGEEADRGGAGAPVVEGHLEAVLVDGVAVLAVRLRAHGPDSSARRQGARAFGRSDWGLGRSLPVGGAPTAGASPDLFHVEHRVVRPPRDVVIRVAVQSVPLVRHKVS